MQALVIAPLLAVEHEERAQALGHAFAAHDEARARRVDVAARGLVVAKLDDGVEADAK